MRFWLLETYWAHVHIIFVKIYSRALFNSSDFWKTWLVHQFNMVSEPQGLGIKSYPTHYSPDYPRLVSSRLSSLDVRGGGVKIYSLALFNSSNFWKTWLVHQFNNFNIWCVLPYKRNRYIGSKWCFLILYSWLFLSNFVFILSLQSAKGAKIYSAAAAAAGDGQPGTKEGEEKVKLHTHSYCCLDYAQVNCPKFSAVLCSCLNRKKYCLVLYITLKYFYSGFTSKYVCALRQIDFY
jgi:hypothetical protein